MGRLDLVPQEFTTARLNGHPVAVRQVHRRWLAADKDHGASAGGQHEAVVVTAVALVRLSLEDVAAVLYDYGEPAEALANDDTLRLLIADMVINAGSARIEELRRKAMGPAAGSEDAAYLAHCRERAAAVFDPRPPAQRPQPRDLAGLR